MIKVLFRNSSRSFMICLRKSRHKSRPWKQDEIHFTKKIEWQLVNPDKIEQYSRDHPARLKIPKHNLKSRIVGLMKVTFTKFPNVHDPLSKNLENTYKSLEYF